MAEFGRQAAANRRIAGHKATKSMCLQCSSWEQAANLSASASSLHSAAQQRASQQKLNSPNAASIELAYEGDTVCTKIITKYVPKTLFLSCNPLHDKK